MIGVVIVGIIAVGDLLCEGAKVRKLTHQLSALQAEVFAVQLTLLAITGEEQ